MVASNNSLIDEVFSKVMTNINARHYENALRLSTGLLIIDFAHVQHIFFFSRC